MTTATDVLRERCEELTERLGALRTALEDIHDYAHVHSTGPAVPDALWDIRAMARNALREDE